MASSPQKHIPETRPIDFRAPPPSPVAPGRRSSFANDDVLTEFLEHSLRVPDLVLPDKIFPKQQILETPPIVDYMLLKYGNFPLIDSAARLGCFQLVNHGIPGQSIRSAVDLASGLIFQVPPEKRANVTLSSENPFGFEEITTDHDQEDDQRSDSNTTLSEEFVWRRDESFKLAMEGILPFSYSTFSDKMEALMSNIETLGERILQIVNQYTEQKSPDGGTGGLSGCYLRRHRRNVAAEGWEKALRYDVIKMLIRGTDYSHALCFHICDGFSEFHVYSKKGWMSFSPEKDALVVTIGDQIQAVSGGQFKHVLGRPIFKSDEDHDHQQHHNNSNISMAFLYSPPPAATINGHHGSRSASQVEEEHAIFTIRQQALAALVLALVCKFLAYIYKKF
ncbi:unnamed protein product [Linum tenue]|uniref:Uncharacterized protein n=1 Tax=Linum tenue TaxID=586396 RepID=A0AAV0KNJ1_9ROSI|nr:unnamed protein product [Linum tenue]